MGEIKSTLDIIMEKTKDLTLTEEEKKAFRKKEIEGKVKGLILKFLDGLMNLKNLKKEITSIDEKDQEVVSQVIKTEFLSRIDPETENKFLFEILAHGAGVDTKPLQGFLSDFHQELDRERDFRKQELSKRILKKGISGSAVLPNIRSDQEWIHYAEDEKEIFLKKLQALLID